MLVGVNVFEMVLVLGIGKYSKIKFNIKMYIRSSSVVLLPILSGVKLLNPNFSIILLYMIFRKS